MAENSEKCPLQLPEVQGNIFKLLVLAEQQPKDIPFRMIQTEERSHICEAGMRESLKFLL